MNKSVLFQWGCFLGILMVISIHATGQAGVSPNTQASIIGRVIDAKSKSPVEYASVTLLQQGTDKIVKGTTADAKGSFDISAILPGNYVLVVEFIGYQPLKKIITGIKKNALIDVKVIALSLNNNSLKEVIVTAPQRLIDNRIDKMVFNAERDLSAQGGVATDLLKKIPQVSVDVDGNVELAGSSSVRFLINGKPSSAFGSNIAEVLQSLPASQIKSIEVITNPGAKYDAQGLGGIINIILKHNTSRGINGNVSVTAGTRTENGSFNLNARRGNFGINAFISGNARLKAATPRESQRTTIDTAAKTDIFLHQEGESKIKRQGYESGIGFDWTYKKYNDFSGSLNYDHFENGGEGIVQQNQMTVDGMNTILSNISSLNKTHNAFRFYNIDANLNYKRRFKKEDQELEFAINNSSGRGRVNAGTLQYIIPQDSLYYGNNSTNPGSNHELEVKADYTQPIRKNVIFGAGAKLTATDITSASEIYSLQLPQDDFIFDTALSNTLKFHQKVYAAYAEISFPIKNILDVKVGGRYERTQTITFFSNVGQQVPETGYNTFVPSVYLSRKLGENQSIHLTYSQRIDRPEYEDLNPFINTGDPKNLSAGNPYLKPETGNRIELSYNRDFASVGSIMFSVFYRNNINDIQPFIIYYPSLTIGDQVYTNVSLNTRENIGNENNTGLNLFGDVHLTNKLTIRSNVSFFHRHSINKIDGVTNGNSFNYRMNGNAAYQFNTIFAAEFFANFNSPRNEVQGKYPSYTSYSFAMRRQLWNKKASIALTALNPFNEYVNQRTLLKGNNFTVDGNRRIPSRSIGINFTWKFGKLDFKKDKEEKPEKDNQEPG